MELSNSKIMIDLILINITFWVRLQIFFIIRANRLTYIFGILDPVSAFFKIVKFEKKTTLNMSIFKTL